MELVRLFFQLEAGRQLISGHSADTQTIVARYEEEPQTQFLRGVCVFG